MRGVGEFFSVAQYCILAAHAICFYVVIWLLFLFYYYERHTLLFFEMHLLKCDVDI